MLAVTVTVRAVSVGALDFADFAICWNLGRLMGRLSTSPLLQRLLLAGDGVADGIDDW